MAIISIIMSIAVIKLGTLDNIKEKNEFRTIIKNIKYARNLALSSREQVEVGFKNDHYDIRISNKSDKKYYENLKMSKCEYSGNSLNFNAAGRPNRAGTIVFLGKERKYILTIGVATGKVNIKGKIE